MLNVFFNMIHAIFYKIIQKKNPRDQQAAPKFYASTASAGKIYTEDLAKEMGKSYTISEGELIGMLYMLGDLVNAHVAQGQTVELRKLGTFQPVIHSKGADTAEAYNANTHVTKITVRFRPDSALLNAAQNAGIQRRA